MIVCLLAVGFFVHCVSQCLEENKAGATFKSYCAVNAADFSNKDDYQHILRISSILYTPSSSSSSSPSYSNAVVLVAGLNQGTIVDLLIGSQKSRRTSVVVHGFEIQNHLVQLCKNKFSNESSIFIHRLGLSNVTTMQRIAGGGEVAGLYSHDAMVLYWRKQVKDGTSWPKQVNDDKVRVTSLSKWTRVNHIRRVDYISIDTEGHEVKVILGMNLEIEENKRKFAAFQFELGGTWKKGDPRRPVNEWNEAQIMAYLTQLGYNLIFIGRKYYVLCDSLDFPELYKQHHEGESTLPGNLLAIHEQYAHPDLLAKIKASLHPDQYWMLPTQVIRASKQVVNLQWGS